MRGLFKKVLLSLMSLSPSLATDGMNTLVESSQVQSTDAQSLIGDLAMPNASPSQVKAIKTFVSQVAKPRLPKSVQSPKRCGNAKGVPAEDSEGKNLLVFVSSSLTKETLKALYQQVSKVGGVLVFRGLINNSFKETQVYFTDVGIAANIDPNLFTEYDIKVAPTFVLKGDKGFDQISGNVSLNAALTAFQDKGDQQDLARSLLAKVKGKTA